MDNRLNIGEINAGFKDAPWYEKSKGEHITLGGVGGIGSNALYCLARTVPAQYFVFDDDIVNTHNIGTQFYRAEQIGQLKVGAIQNTMVMFGSGASIYPFSRKIVTDDTVSISIAAFDNMPARKQLFEGWRSLDSRQLFIDGRLRASMYEVYAVTKGREEEYEKTLFDDADADDGPCTFKQTAYFAMLIGARITHVLVNYLINKYSKEDICNLPFKIQEVGEPFYIQMK